MYSLYGHWLNFKVKWKYQHYVQCFQIIFLFLMTMAKRTIEKWIRYFSLQWCKIFLSWIPEFIVNQAFHWFYKNSFHIETQRLSLKIKTSKTIARKRIVRQTTAVTDTYFQTVITTEKICLLNQIKWTNNFHFIWFKVKNFCCSC